MADTTIPFMKEPYWDSYGGAPTDPGAHEVASLIANSAPKVIPTTGGGFNLEWSNERWAVEIEIVHQPEKRCPIRIEALCEGPDSD